MSEHETLLDRLHDGILALGLECRGDGSNEDLVETVLLCVGGYQKQIGTLLGKLRLAWAELERLRAVENAAREFFEAQQATEFAWSDRIDAAFRALRAALHPAPSEPPASTTGQPDPARPARPPSQESNR